MLEVLPVLLIMLQRVTVRAIVCTEEGVGYKLKTQNPDKTFYYPDRLPVCPNMKKNTLEKILHVLKTGENEVHVSDALRENSKKPLEKMLELAAK